MIRKLFLAVLTLAALSVPARAAVITYCSGTGCGANNLNAFTNMVTTNNYTDQGPETFSSTNLLSGANYTDNLTLVQFADTDTKNGFSINGTQIQTSASGDGTIVITIPATYTAIQLNVNIGAGLCLDAFCPANETSGFVGFINSSPTGAWTVNVGPLGASQTSAIISFDVFTAQQSSGGAPSGDDAPADTPEASTLLLIGSGLIGMRWLKRRAPQAPAIRTTRPSNNALQLI